MPDPIYSPGVAQFRLQYLWAGQHVENVYHCQSELIWTDSQLRIVANTFKNWWTTQMVPKVTNQLQLVRVLAGELTADGVQILETSGLPVSGGKTEQSVPNNVTVAVHWGTGRAGRSYQGRTYHLGLTVASITGSQMTTNDLGPLQSVYDGLRTALDNVTLAVEFGVLSKYHNKLPRPQGVLTPITGVSIDYILDSQRRRLPGRGQ